MFAYIELAANLYASVSISSAGESLLQKSHYYFSKNWLRTWEKKAKDLSYAMWVHCTFAQNKQYWKGTQKSDAVPCNTISIFFDFDKDWQVEKGVNLKMPVWTVHF